MKTSEEFKVVDILPWKDEPDYVYLIDATKSVYKDVSIYRTSYTKKENDCDAFVYDTVKLVSDIAQNVIDNNPDASWYSSYDKRRDLVRISGNASKQNDNDSSYLEHTMIIIIINRAKIIHFIPQENDPNAEDI